MLKFGEGEEKEFEQKGTKETKKSGRGFMEGIKITSRIRIMSGWWSGRLVGGGG